MENLNSKNNIRTIGVKTLTQAGLTGTSILSGILLAKHHLETGFVTPQYLEASTLTYIAAIYTGMEYSRQKILEVLKDDSK